MLQHSMLTQTNLLTGANLLELLLSVSILSVLIGMILQTELPVGLLDLGRICTALHTQDTVEVTPCQH